LLDRTPNGRFRRRCCGDGVHDDVGGGDELFVGVVFLVRRCTVLLYADGGAGCVVVQGESPLVLPLLVLGGDMDVEMDRAAAWPFPLWPLWPLWPL
jgi:hypothetical protein